MADWNKLPRLLVTKIAEHIEHYEDFETFRWVCSLWRIAAKKANFRAYYVNNNNNLNKSTLPHDHTLPWLLLPQSDELSLSRRFYSLSNGMSRVISLPDPPTLDNGIKYDFKRIFSSHGWLLIVSRSTKFCMFNPFTRAIIELPQLNDMRHRVQRHICYSSEVIYIDKFVLSANPSTTSNFTVFLSLENLDVISFAKLVYWRNGDAKWTPCLKDEHHSIHYLEGFLSVLCCDVTFYRGEFYGINLSGTVVKFETARGRNPYKTIAECGSSSEQDDDTWLYYLVELAGKLLVIRQVVTPDRNKGWRRFTRRFEVYELDVMKGNSTLKEVQSLGNRAVFIGSNSSFSVEASPAHGFKPNCIYFTQDRVDHRWSSLACYGEDITCLYNLTDKKFEKFYNGPSKLEYKITPLMWVESPTSSCLSCNEFRCILFLALLYYFAKSKKLKQLS